VPTVRQGIVGNGRLLHHLRSEPNKTLEQTAAAFFVFRKFQFSGPPLLSMVVRRRR
jgi:hypothetical protein